MPIDLNDEIVQDFLVEAGELLERLGEQLVDLETQPEDTELLNSVFRSFHTIKGGAGFIGLDPLVNVCHRAEDVFNLLRQGERRVDPYLMDVILKALDTVNEMFASVRAGSDPEPASPQLMADLERLLAGDAPAAAPAAPAEPAPPPEPAAQAEAPAAAASPDPANGATTSDEITDEEFEALLDALEGKGEHPAITGDAAAAGASAPAPEASPAPPAGKQSGDAISDDEFEALLDQLHGPGKHSGAPAPEPAAAAAPASPAPDPAPASDAGAAAKSAAPRQGAGGAEAPKASQGETTIRVDTGILDHIMNMVGELVLVRNRLAALDASSEDEALSKAVSNLDVVTADLQAGVMRTRMQPIRKVFGRFPRVVRDLARHLEKDVVLEMDGEETDLDKNLVDALADPLVHLVRNAVDHGVEQPEARRAAGKNPQGKVLLSAEQEGDHILLLIRDDGGGMDADVLRAKAVEKGLMDRDAAARLEDREAYGLIFAPGFSTKTEISDVSGRGVGMDVVKTRIAQLNGSIDIDSELGKGTTIRIKVPLTLAIVPTLMVLLQTQIFAFPLVNVSEIFDLKDGMTNVVDGQLVARVRDRPLPLFFLGQWLVQTGGGDASAGKHVVVVHVGTQQVGFVVDHLLGQEEVVIKPLGAMLQGTRGLAGATITGDGRIALILDVASLIGAHAGRH